MLLQKNRNFFAKRIEPMELNVFSPHEQALKFRAIRNQVLTNNIANADTPNYKARDFDFSTMLREAKGGSLALQGTSDRHIGTSLDRASGLTSTSNELKYRVPNQPSLDGGPIRKNFWAVRPNFPALEMIDFAYDLE